MKYFLPSLISGFVFLWACKNSTPDPVKKDPVTVEYCDSLKATYNTHVAPLINSTCAISDCHDIAGAGVNIRMRNYAEVKTEAAKPNFLKVIKHEAGVSPMPSGQPKLSDDKIKMLECWISKGFVEK
jgi:hypothetical protein